jgi:hypothetical protein
MYTNMSILMYMSNFMYISNVMYLYVCISWCICQASSTYVYVELHVHICRTSCCRTSCRRTREHNSCFHEKLIIKLFPDAAAVLCRYTRRHKCVSYLSAVLPPDFFFCWKKTTKTRFLTPEHVTTQTCARFRPIGKFFEDEIFFGNNILEKISIGQKIRAG